MNKDPLKNTFQQGDVILRRLDAMPEGEQKLVSKGRCILRHGESGHAHVIDAPETEAELIMIGERMLLTLRSPQAVQHVKTPHGNEPLVAGEHQDRVIDGEPDAGIWEVGGVREIDHFAEQERRVVD